MPASTQIAALVDFLANSAPWNADPAVADLQQASPVESQLAAVVEKISELRALIVDVGSSVSQLQEVKAHVLEKERKAKTALHALERELFLLEKDKSSAEDAIVKEWNRQRELEANLWELCAVKDNLEAQIAAHNNERAAMVARLLQRVTEQQQSQIRAERQQLLQVATAQQQREKEVQNLKELLEEQMSEMERLNNQAHTQQAESLQRELVLRHEIHELEDALHNRTFGGDPDSVDLDSARQLPVPAKAPTHDVSTDTVEDLDVSALTTEAENIQQAQIEQQRQELEQLRRQVTNLQSRVQLNDRMVSNLEETNSALRAEAEALRALQAHSPEPKAERGVSPSIPSAPIDEILPPSPSSLSQSVAAPELQSLLREMGELRANVSQLMERDKSTTRRPEPAQAAQATVVIAQPPTPPPPAPIAQPAQQATKPFPAAVDETKPYLRSTEDQLAKLLGLEVTDGSNFGVRVASVRPGSLAERAGITAGDLIAFCNDLHLRQSHDFWTIVRLSRISDVLPLKLLRGTLPTRHTVFCQLAVDPNSPLDNTPVPAQPATAAAPAGASVPLPTITHFGSPPLDRRQATAHANTSRSSPVPATSRRSVSPSVTRL